MPTMNKPRVRLSATGKKPRVRVPSGKRAKLSIKTGKDLEASKARNRSSMRKKRLASKSKKTSLGSKAIRATKKVARRVGPMAALTGLAAAAEHSQTPEGREASTRWSQAGSSSAGVRAGKNPKMKTSQNKLQKPKAKPKTTPKTTPKPAPKPTRKVKKSSGDGMGKFGRGTEMTVTHKGRKMANVDRSQLKATGLSLREYMNQWKKTGKRPTGKK